MEPVAFAALVPPAFSWEFPKLGRWLSSGVTGVSFKTGESGGISELTGLTESVTISSLGPLALHLRMWSKWHLTTLPSSRQISKSVGPIAVSTMPYRCLGPDAKFFTITGSFTSKLLSLVVWLSFILVCVSFTFLLRSGLSWSNLLCSFLFIINSLGVLLVVDWGVKR